MGRAEDKHRKGELPDYLEVPEDGFEILSWCPSPTPTVPPTQVHLVFPTIAAMRLFVRFKSPRTLDLLIAALIDHRKHVWGDPQAKPEASRG